MIAFQKAADWISAEEIEGSGSILKLPGIGVEIPLERIYERTTIAGARASGG